MKTYQRSAFVTFKNVLSIPAAGFVVYLVLSFFVESALLLYGIPAAIMLVMLYFFVFDSNLKITISEDGIFTYYKGKKQEHQFNLANCYVGYKARTDGQYLDLYISDAETGEEVVIDGEPLGNSRFFKMYEYAQTFAKEEEVMKAD